MMKAITHDDFLQVYTSDPAAAPGRIEAIRNTLAAGATIQAAELGLTEPSFALVRPPGRHASADRSWGFCYFCNITVAVERLSRMG